ncbi:MAG: glycosyltransferase family 2 protein [Streptosporangiaceae bacterium]
MKPVLLPAAPFYDEPLESLLEPIAFDPEADRGNLALAVRTWPVPANSVALKLSILVTVHNQEAIVAQAISDILNVGYPCAMELIVIDDGSTDGTYDLLAKIGDDRVTIFRHRVRQGKSAALRTASSLATGSYLLAFDGGPEYSAEDIPWILRPVLAGRCQVVYGTCLSGYNTVYRPRRQVRRTRLLTLLANVLFDACVRDLNTGFKLVPRAMFDELTLRERDAGLDTEMTALLLKRGVRPFEVPVSYYGGSASAAKELSWRQLTECVRILLRVRLRTGVAGPACRKPAHDLVHDAPVICSDHPNLSEAC